MAVPNLNGYFKRWRTGGARLFVQRILCPGARHSRLCIDNPIDAIDLKFLTNQIVNTSYNDAVGRRIEIDHVTRLRRAAGQSFALADSKELYSFVFPDKVSVDVVNLAAVKFRFIEMRAQKSLVIVARHKTDFLAIDLVCDLPS